MPEDQLSSKKFCDNSLKQSKIFYTASPLSKLLRRKVKFFTRLRLWVSHFIEHKFKRRFQDSLRPFCNCRTGELELCFHYLFYCFNASYESLFHLNSFKRIGSFILSQNDSEISRTVLSGDIKFNFSVNTIILNANIKYLTGTEIFEGCFQ